MTSSCKVDTSVYTTSLPPTYIAAYRLFRSSQEKEGLLTGPQFIKCVGQLLSTPETLRVDEEQEEEESLAARLANLSHRASRAPKVSSSNNNNNINIKNNNDGEPTAPRPDQFNPIPPPISPPLANGSPGVRSGRRQTKRITGFGLGTYKATPTKEVSEAVKRRVDPGRSLCS